MLLNFHLPQYFNKSVRREIGELYASSAISNMALAVVMLFEPIFLYSVLNYTVPKILLFMAVVYAVYIITIPYGAKFASVFGYRHSIALSVPFQVFYWFALLSSVNHPNLAFFGAVIFGIQKSFYWPGFHSVMARYGQQEQVGREFSMVYAIISISHVVGPLVGGLLSQYFGIPAAFLFSAVLYCCSIIPILTAQEIFIPKIYKFSDTLELYKSYPKKFIGYLGFGEELIVLTIWPIFIYLIVKDYEGTGFLATMASLAAALLALFLGKITDQYTKRILIKIGAFMSSLVWVARFIATSVMSVFVIDSLSRASKEIDFIPISTLTYLRAEATHVVPYAVFFEQSLAIGKLIACILGIILFSLTGSFMVLFILAAVFSLLYMYI